jgi:hypothetical protein
VATVIATMTDKIGLRKHIKGYPDLKHYKMSNPGAEESL